MHYFSSFNVFSYSFLLWKVASDGCCSHRKGIWIETYRKKNNDYMVIKVEIYWYLGNYENFTEKKNKSPFFLLLLFTHFNYLSPFYHGWHWVGAAYMHIPQAVCHPPLLPFLLSILIQKPYSPHHWSFINNKFCLLHNGTIYLNIIW